MPEFKTYKTENGAEVQAYQVEEAHQVNTIAGPRDVAPGLYVVQRDRPELVDVFPADLFESEHKAADSDEAADVTPMATPGDDAEDEDYDPTQHTVAEVQQYLRENPDQRDAVLAREREGANRTALTR